MKFEIPQDEIWVRQAGYSMYTIMNAFMVKAATEFKDFVRNANFTTDGERLIVTYEVKVEKAKEVEEFLA